MTGKSIDLNTIIIHVMNVQNAVHPVEQQESITKLVIDNQVCLVGNINSR